MTTCPSCGAAAENPRDPFYRRRYVCGTCGMRGMKDWQSDLCRAWQRIRDVRAIVTTDDESKEQLIARVKELLQE